MKRRRERIVELSVHSLDLAPAIRQAPILNAEAQAFTVRVLEALLDRPRSCGFQDDLTFIEAATGRLPGSGLSIPAFQ